MAAHVIDKADRIAVSTMIEKRQYIAEQMQQGQQAIQALTGAIAAVVDRYKVALGLEGSWNLSLNQQSGEITLVQAEVDEPQEEVELEDAGQ